MMRLILVLILLTSCDVKVEIIQCTSKDGHDYGKWKVEESFTNNMGHPADVMVRECLECGIRQKDIISPHVGL